MNKSDKFIIEGLAGRKMLRGKVKINGAKNAALKAMAAAILFDGPVTLNNIPDTNDTRTLLSILKKLGAKASVVKDGRLKIDATSIHRTSIDKALAQSMRTSVVLTGPMLARYRKVSLPAPGGCVIGARPIDLFIGGYRKMSAKVALNNEVYEMSAGGGLKSAQIRFKKKSVTATETLMMAAVLGNGTTTLKSCALEPEIVNVAEWLNANGAHIKGVGTPTIKIQGTKGKLLSAKIPYFAIPDRIETGSFLILGALCAEDLTIEDCIPKHIESLVKLLQKSGLNISTTASTVRITKNTRPSSSLKSVNMRTKEYPGFPTDLQAPLVTFLTQVNGKSAVTETIFEGRFKYVKDLNKMGADISRKSSRKIIIKGPSQLRALTAGRELQAHDIRAGFAIVLAALVGKGRSVINNVHLIDRGYEKLEKRLSELGANIARKAKK